MLAELLTPYQHDTVNRIVTNLDEAVTYVRDAAMHSDATIMALPAIAHELKRLNDNLEAGRAINVRQHVPVCVAPPNGDFSIRQLEVMSSFLHHAIETGALVLPAKEGAES